MVEFIKAIPSFILAIVILVTVHEFGHFYVARRCGIKVLRFSIGIGKVLWRKYDKHGTEYAISALPVGGYVKMLDEREGEVDPSELHQAFTRKPVWQRMAVVLAGPVANFILAFLLFWMLIIPGERGLIPVVGKVAPGSIAAQAGLQPGQEILAVDGEPTETEQQLGRRLVSRLGESGTISFRVRDPHSSQEHQLQAILSDWLGDAKDPDPISGLGIELSFPLKAILREVVPNSPAAHAGFKPGDEILAADGKAISDFYAWASYVRANPGKPIEVEVARSGQRISLHVTPESFKENGVSYGRVGVAPQPPPDELFRHYEYSVGGALVAAVQRTWDTSVFVLLSVKKLILGEISTKNLSGPISIAKVAGSSAQIGLKSFIGFLATISVFLAVFNLLPVPVLDGGHMVYLLLEAVRGKPVSEKVQMFGFQVGLALVITLSILAMYNDILRL